jgi:oxygen-dependent protoporphyrinogen oxidase
MPQYYVGHLDRVAQIEALAHRHPRFALCGNAYRGVGIPDAVRSANDAVARILTAP